MGIFLSSPLVGIESMTAFFLTTANFLSISHPHLFLRPHLYAVRDPALRIAQEKLFRFLKEKLCREDEEKKKKDEKYTV